MLDDDDVTDPIVDVIEEYAQARPRRRGGGLLSWFRRRLSPEVRAPAPPAKPQRPRLLAPGGVPFTPHDVLVARVEEDRRRRAPPDVQVPVWELEYKHKGKLIREIIPASEVEDEGDIIARLYKQGVKLEQVIRLERKG